MPMLSARALPGLLADRDRMLVLGAVALGAAEAAELPGRTGLPARVTQAALHRLQSGGLVVDGPAGLEVAYDRLRALAAAPAPAEPDPAPHLHPFVQGQRLRSLPAQRSRRRQVLAHVAEQAFAPGTDYDESAVNALLSAWCAGGEVDHAALRRYLVEEQLVSRGSGVYRLGAGAAEPGLGERRVQALGLT